MNAGSIFFDRDFVFHDGEIAEKLFVVLGSSKSLAVVAKTTSRANGRGAAFGCRLRDRFANFHLPAGSCALKRASWICLDEFYELNYAKLLQKRFSGAVQPV